MDRPSEREIASWYPRLFRTALRLTIEAGKTARLTGRLPWPDGSPWSSWTSTLVGTAYPGIDPGLWIFDDGRPAILADDEAIRLVWSYRGDLWSSVTADGERFSPPRRLDLPVSTGWRETAPCLARDERGRFILVFLSDRDARHRTLAYVCWSRDFVHWSAPSLVCDKGILEARSLMTDDRGRLVYLVRASGGYEALVSADAYQWEAKSVPGCALAQDPSGRFIAYNLVGEQASGPGPKKPFQCRLSCKKSSDLASWAQEEKLAECEWAGLVPQRPVIACQGKSGPAVLGFGAPDEWSLALWEPNAEGRWEMTGRLWGLLPDYADVARLACPAVAKAGHVPHGWTSQPCHMPQCTPARMSGGRRKPRGHTCGAGRTSRRCASIAARFLRLPFRKLRRRSALRTRLSWGPAGRCPRWGTGSTRWMRRLRRRRSSRWANSPTCPR